jgi:hypothetical protein
MLRLRGQKVYCAEREDEVDVLVRRDGAAREEVAVAGRQLRVPVERVLQP